jgi:plastocyanin domain-containing protein
LKYEHFALADSTRPVEKAAMRWLPLTLIALLACNHRPRKTEAPQIIEMVVNKDGFVPPRIEVAPGQSVVLRITRKTSETCADAIVVQGDPVRHMLPLDQTVEVRAKAPESGDLAFACPMNMIRGAIAVVGQ